MSPHQQNSTNPIQMSPPRRSKDDNTTTTTTTTTTTIVRSESLLVQALEYDETPLHDTDTASSLLLNNNNNNNNILSASSSPSTLMSDPIIPVHSDFTIPTSNVSPYTPQDLLGAASSALSNSNNNDNTPPRRGVFGGRVEQKYNVANTILTANNNGDHNHNNNNNNNSSGRSLPVLWTNEPPVTCTSIQPLMLGGDANDNDETNGFHSQVSALTDADLTPPTSPKGKPRAFAPPSSSSKRKNRNNIMSPPSPPENANNKPIHETIHIQSLILGVAFMAIWSPQNCMAPNLTQMAQFFGFSEVERDFYLGANVAFATGVLSLPIAGGIGILADVYNRKYLFCATVALGGISSYLTGASQTYRGLFLARLLNGAFMSGSTPVAFSLLGDLFDTNERNAASSGLTAMMGMGIILGQVYAGVVGSSEGWSHAFNVSAIVTLLSALAVLLWVREPIRGGKEQVLQDMLRRGTRYERKLTWSGFMQTMRNNESNKILMWQGFFSSIPWGIIFVFLNDYLSQERGFSVPDATYLVAVFGIGCACGGVLGGYWGGIVQALNRSYLPIFMAFTTFMGIFPFVGLLNGTFTNAHGYLAVGYSFLGGFVASLPSVCIRPCLINVNPPETRGAALTAANLVINLARGAGPSCITLLGAIFQINRQTSFNITLSVFWTFSAIQLLLLSKTLPKDQDAMDADLAQYAATALAERQRGGLGRDDESATLVSIEDRMTSWDEVAARESMQFVGAAFKEIGAEVRTSMAMRPSLHLHCNSDRESDEEDNGSEMDRAYVERRRQAWIQQQKQMNWQQQQHHEAEDDKAAHERTRLL